MEPAVLHELVRQVELVRVVNRYGFVSVQRLYLYAERGLARQRAAVRIFEGHLQLAYQQPLLAEYQHEYNRAARRLQPVSNPTLYPTPFDSPQLELFELAADPWLKLRPRPDQCRPHLSLPEVKQMTFHLASLLLLPLGGGWRPGGPIFAHFM